MTKVFKQWLEEQFDSKVVIDSSRSHKEDQELEKKGLCEVTMMDGVGAEMFAKHAFDYRCTDKKKHKADASCPS